MQPNTFPIKINSEEDLAQNYRVSQQQGRTTLSLLICGKYFFYYSTLKTCRQLARAPGAGTPKEGHIQTKPIHHDSFVLVFISSFLSKEKGDRQLKNFAENQSKTGSVPLGRNR